MAKTRLKPAKPAKKKQAVQATKKKSARPKPTRPIPAKPKSAAAKKPAQARPALRELGVIVGPHPADKPALIKFVKDFCSLDIPSVSMCPNHQSPMDYLSASFFAQEDLLVWANRGGGKTMLAAVATLLDGLFNGPAKIRVLGGSFDQSDRLAEYIRDILDRRSEVVAGRITRSCVKLLGGSEIRMLAQSQRAVRGQHVQKIRCDEVDLFDPEVWKAVQFITRSSSQARGSIEVLSTLHRSGGLMQKLVDAARAGTPASPATITGSVSPNLNGYRLINWCLWEVIERCPPSRQCGDCLLYDDCQGIARRGTGFFSIDDAIAIRSRSSRQAWDAEMLCKGPGRCDWLVFSEFGPARHVEAITYCSQWPTYRAIDFGYRDPFVCLWIQVTPSGCVNVLDEYVQDQLPLLHHSRAIKQKDAEVTGLPPGRAGIAATYVDPAGGQKESTSGSACTELLASDGIVCTSRGSNISDGLELIRSALAPAGQTKPNLLIHPRCRRLIDSLNAYHYPPPGSSADGDSPVKDGPDHCIDALRYFFINRMMPKAVVSRGRY
jgi:hypothetical protein